MSDIIVGRNAVSEALKAQRSINKILIVKGATEGSIKEIIGQVKSAGIPIQEVERSYLDKLSEGQKHQGVAAMVAAKEYVEIEDIIEIARARKEEPFIVVLDGIEDPHNFGSLLRSAEVAGVHGVVIPKRRAVGVTSTVAKSSAGAVEYMAIARVANITQAIEKLKELGCWVAASDMDGQELWDATLTGPIALVVGGEGKGVSRLVKEHCDFVVKIPMKGNISSLNASVAGAILMFEVVRQRK